MIIIIIHHIIIIMTVEITDMGDFKKFLKYIVFKYIYINVYRIYVIKNY